mmetsp:Transcript_3077/g.8440  ORF Transcript_3077/g.8440 Transcript_3077/m.8440 type:complete len:125 (-) Transcript_3077:1609-1983(-)
MKKHPNYFLEHMGINCADYFQDVNARVELCVQAVYSGRDFPGFPAMHTDVGRVVLPAPTGLPTEAVHLNENAAAELRAFGSPGVQAETGASPQWQASRWVAACMSQLHTSLACFPTLQGTSSLI